MDRKTKSKTPDADVAQWRLVSDVLARDVRRIPRGSTLLTARLQARCPGRVLWRQQIEEWIAVEPERRVEPKAGMALILMEESGLLFLENREILEAQTPNSKAVAKAGKQ
jgi:hypothetical protein